MLNSALREKFYFAFFKIFLLVLTQFSFWQEDLALSYHSMKFLTFIYQFITNNYASFHLWWKEYLEKHKKVSKYYDNNCLQNILLVVFIKSCICQKQSFFG